MRIRRRKGMRPKPYPSDLTDARWAILEPLLPPARTCGRPRKTDLREVVNAIFYRNRNGCTWRALPARLPALEDRLQLLQAVDGRRHLAGDQRRPADPGPPAGGPGADPQRPAASTARRSRRPRSAARTASTGPSSSPAGSGTSSWTRWACSWRSSSPPPRRDDGTAAPGCWRSCRRRPSPGWRCSGRTTSTTTTP